MMPKVSVVVTAYLEQSRPYLDLCVKSLQNLNYPKDRLEIILVSPAWYKPEYDRVLNISPNLTTYNNAYALNFGASVITHDIQYILFTNDDCIFTKNSLVNLIASSQIIGDRGIFMPISNDQQQRYMWPVPYIPSGSYRIDQMAWDDMTFSVLTNAGSPYQRGMIFCETLCLYAVLVPRPVWNLVGKYDEAGWQDDIDYTRRVAKAGLVNAICMNSLVYHAGGVTADVTLGALDSKARAESLKSYNEKWEKIDGSV